MRFPKDLLNKSILSIGIILLILITIFTLFQTYNSTQGEYAKEDGLKIKQRENEEKVRSYAAYGLEIIKNTPIRQGDKMILEGTVVNKGNQLLNDILLMVCIVDFDSMDLIDRRTLQVPSKNGKPLKKGGRRYFSFEVEGVTAENPKVFITVDSIDFESSDQEASKKGASEGQTRATEGKKL